MGAHAWLRDLIVDTQTNRNETWIHTCPHDLIDRRGSTRDLVLVDAMLQAHSRASEQKDLHQQFFGESTTQQRLASRVLDGRQLSNDEGVKCLKKVSFFVGRSVKD